jgi:hypothetical protein
VAIVIAAERAFLGAVLLDPAGQRHLLALVTPDDFARPWHGQVLAAMRRLDSRGVLPGLAEVHQEMKADPDLPRHVSHDGTLLADLADATPRPSHAPAYAGLVISAAIRRQAGIAGTRICQAAASQAEQPFPDGTDPDHARRAAAAARRELAACQSRWEALPVTVRRELPAPRRDTGLHADTARRAALARDEITRLHAGAWTQHPDRLAGRLAALTRLLAESAAATATSRQRRAAPITRHPARPAGPAADAAGLAVLRDLAADPSRLASLVAWLQPGHFARPEHGETYAALRDLHAAGMPADPVTISQETHRRGASIDPRDLAGGTGALASGHARQLWRRAFLARADQAGLGIQAAAADPALTAAALLDHAASLLDRLDREAGPPARHPERHPTAAPARPALAASPRPAHADGEHAREAAG